MDMLLMVETVKEMSCYLIIDMQMLITNTWQVMRKRLKKKTVSIDL